MAMKKKGQNSHNYKVKKIDMTFISFSFTCYKFIVTFLYNSDHLFMHYSYI